jgi:hypothetical protein
VVARHGGVVEKFIGDALMAVFGVPHVHEDDARRAVRAALDLARELETLNNEPEIAYGVRLATRTGINTGEVAVGAGGEILIAETTRRLVRGAVDVEPTGPLELRGKSAPVEACRRKMATPRSRRRSRRCSRRASTGSAATSEPSRAPLPWLGRTRNAARRRSGGQARRQRSPRECARLLAGGGKPPRACARAASAERSTAAGHADVSGRDAARARTIRRGRPPFGAGRGGRAADRLAEEALELSELFERKGCIVCVSNTVERLEALGA